jgi:hypothetical protein
VATFATFRVLRGNPPRGVLSHWLLMRPDAALSPVVLGLAVACVGRAPEPNRPSGGGQPAAVQSGSRDPAAGPTMPVHAVLLECETVEPIKFEQSMPDGRVSESIEFERGQLKVRLHIRLENICDHALLVSICNGALRVIDAHSPRPPCAPLDASWASLAARDSMVVFPTILRPNPAEGVFFEELLPNFGHAPDPSWLSYVPNAVSFQLAETGCSVGDAQ